MSTVTEVQEMYANFKAQLASRSEPERKFEGQLRALKEHCETAEVDFAFAKTSGNEETAKVAKEKILRFEEQIAELERLLRGFRAGGLSTLVRNEENQTIFSSAQQVHAAAHSTGRKLLEEDFQAAVNAAIEARRAYLESISHIAELERQLIALASILYGTRQYVSEKNLRSPNTLRPRHITSFIAGFRVEDEDIMKAFGNPANWQGFFYRSEMSVGF